MGWIRCGVLPCPFLLLFLAGCAPLPAGSAPPVDTAALLDGGNHSGPMGLGRSYGLSQALFREQQRSASLQEQLAQRAQEMEELRGEVQQLQAHEGELRAELERVTKERITTGPENVAAVKRGADSGGGGAAPQPAAAALPVPAAAPDDAERRAAEAARAGLIASLRNSLTQEQQRRQDVESQLARLKEETSSPAYSTAEADLAAAKQEVNHLRGVLDDERNTREELELAFRALKARAAQDAARAPATAPDDAQVRTRLEQLQSQQQAAAESFTRALADSQKRVADLEQQLAVSRANAAVSAASVAVAPAVDAGQLSSIRAQNTALRTRLDEEHRHTEELAAKLKLATRVADLIFRMQGQQAEPAQVR